MQREGENAIKPATKYACVIYSIVFSLTVLVSCTQEGKRSASPTGETAAGKNPTESSAGDLDVRIEPAGPTAVSDLQAMSSGAGAVSYLWSRNGNVLDGESRNRLPKAQYAKGDTIAVTVTSGDRSGTASVVINNSPPVISSVSFSPKDVRAGQDITAMPEGQDADGDGVRYSYKWSINGEDEYEDSPQLAGNKIKRGDTLLLTIIPTDGDGEGQPFKSDPVIVPNSPPRITSTPPQMEKSETYTYAVAARDPDGDEVSYSLAAAPQGMTIDGKSGIISWPITSESTGEHSIEIVAQDSSGAKSVQKFTLTIAMAEREK